MGFGDILGDTFDTFRDVGEQSLGVAMDYAKASTSVAQGESPWRATRQFTTSFSRRRNDFQSEHKTLARLSKGALRLTEGGLYALGYPAHIVQRVASTGIQHDGPLDIPGLGGNAKSPSLRDAWRNSAKTSTGQALLVAAGQAGPGTEGITFKNAWKYGDRSQDEFNSQFSWRSGTLDALMIFTDPLIGAGKGTKAVRTSREKITADDLKALADPTVGKSTRRTRRVQSDHETILDATDGTDELQNFTLFKRHDVNNAAGLASVLAQAKHDRATRSLILRHSMGDPDATAALKAQREDLIDQIDRMNKDLDDQIYPAFGTPGHDGLFDSDYWDNPAAREELLRQRDESESILDIFNRTVGDDQKLIDSATPTQDEVGLGIGIQKRIKAGRRDLRWMEGQSAYYVQPGVGGIVTRVVRAPHNMRPSGYVDFHDADQAVREVDALTKRVPGLLPEQRTDMMNRFINAQDDNARRQVLLGIEDDIFSHLGKHYKYDEEDVRELVNKFMTERQQAIMKARQKDNIYGFHADGTAEHRPLGEAQLDNGAYTLPIDLIKRTLYRNAGAYRAFKNASGTAFSITEQMADLVNDLWRFTALFRGGYPIRNAADGQLRMMAYLTATSYLGIQKEAAGVALRNEAKIAKATARRQDATQVEKEIFGMGERKIGPYEGLSDAMGKTPDEVGLYHEQISSADSTAAFIGGKYTEVLNALRASGRWKGKKGDAEGWEDDFLRVVNHQFRNQAITQRLLRGDSPEKVVKWLKSGQARALRRRMVFGEDTAEALVLRNIENLNHALPKQYWRTASERPLTADDIAEMWAKPTDRPIINAEQIEFSMGVGNAAELLQKVQRHYFDTVARLTDDQMGRHPLFVSLYRGQQIELMKRMDPKMKGTLELADQKRIEHQARIWARRETKRIMFDVAQKSDLAHFVRFIMPFYAAWQDAITKYSRLLVRDPSRLAYLQQAWTAPNDSSFLEVTNSDGEPVSAKDSKLSDDEGVVIPYSWAKKMGLSWSPKISKASFNIALQGDPLWLPGWGPFGTVPVNETIRATDNTNLAKFAEEVGILPFGVQDYGKFGAKAFFAGGLRQYALPEGRRQRLYASVMQDMYFQAAREGKPEPSREAINSRYRELLNLRGLTSAMSPVGIQYQSPYQFYIDQSHAYDAKVGVPGGFKDFAEADRAFLRDFGEDYYIFRMSMSKTNVPIRPSVRADKEARRLRDLVESNPKYAALFIGPANTGEYDRNIYTLQQGRRIDGTLDNWRDTYSNPAESIRLNRVEQGWIEYQRFSARINNRMEALGATSLNQTSIPGVAELKQMKHDWIEQVAGPGGPDWGQAWYQNFQEFGSSSVTDFLGAVKQAAADPRINTRPDIQVLNLYVLTRERFRQVLQQRYAAGGSASITSETNGDLATAWGGLMTKLRQSNVFFEDYWSRYLERDDLTKVVR